MDGKVFTELHNKDSTGALINAEAVAKFKEFGYYALYEYIHTIKLNSRSNPIAPLYKSDMTLLFLNTNACNNKNLELMKETDDVGGQLKWLEEELLKVEKDTAHNAVWIFGNMNPGSKYCNAQWAKRYQTLIERFQHIVRL